MAEAQACETLDKMFKLRVLLGGLNRTLGGKRACLAELVDATLIRVKVVSTAALYETGGSVSKAICDMPEGLRVQASSEAPRLCASGSSNQV